MRVEYVAIVREIRRAGLDDRAVRVIQTGIGKAAVLRTLERELAQRPHASPPPRFVVLAGCCGGLIPTDDVPRIARVVDDHGGVWTIDPAAGGDPQGVDLAAVDEVVSTPGAKAALAQRTGAAIVDMEAHAFARFCVARSLPWTVVRGVSDTPDQTLPDEILGWVTPAGDSRPFAAAAGLLRRPTLIPHIAGFVRRCNRVLPLVGRRVAEILR